MDLSNESTLLKIFDDLSLLSLFCDMHKMGYVCLHLADKIQIADANEYFYNMLNVTHSEMKNHNKSNFDRFINSENKKILMDCFVSDNEASIHECTIVVCGKKANFRHLSLCGVTSIIDGITTFCGTVSDVTDHLGLDELQKKNFNYKTVLSLLNIAAIEYDINKDEFIHEEITADKFGIPLLMRNPEEEFVKIGLVPAESLKPVKRWFKRVRAGEHIVEERFVSHNLDGDKVYLRILGKTIFDEFDKPCRVIGLHQDITEEVQLEKEREYSVAMTSDKLLIYEANLTKDVVVNASETWLKSNNFTKFRSFTAMMKHAAQSVVDPEYLEVFLETFNSEKLLEKYEAGERTLTYDYRRIMSDGNKLWYEITANMIYSTSASAVLVRIYINDVHEDKVKEIRLNEEKIFFDKMSKTALATYEINLSECDYDATSNNSFADTPLSGKYTDIFSIIPKANIFKEDISKINILNAQQLIDAYANSKSEFIYEFRVLCKNNSYEWIRCTLRIFDNPETNHLMAYLFIEDINSDKVSELELIYKAQHDMLTGLYNKITSKEKVIESIKSLTDDNLLHAFFMIDLDNFKMINDTFGHAYGDKVLKDVSSRLSTIFRDNDIIGRVGGDEFVVLLKNIPDNKIVISKARDICKALKLSYEKEGITISISSSVGVELCTSTDMSYDELYQKADEALYISKKSGKNKFTISGNAEANDVEITSEIASRGRNYNDYAHSIVEHVFTAMYGAEDKDSALSIALTIIGNHYGFDRINVRTYADNPNFLEITKEWYKKPEYKLAEAGRTFARNNLIDKVSFFDEDGTFVISEETDSLCEFFAAIRKMYNLHTLLVVIPSKVHGKPELDNGLITFDYMNATGHDIQQVRKEIKKIADLFALFNII